MEVTQQQRHPNQHAADTAADLPDFDAINDYFDREDQTPDDKFEKDPHTSHVLQQLRRLRSLTAEFSEQAASRIETTPEWWNQLTSMIVADARPGRVIPFDSAEPAHDLGVTEGALKALIRDASDTVDSCFVTRIELPDNITEPGAEITIMLRVTVAAGTKLLAAADAIRAAVCDQLEQHTTLRVAAIDVEISDVLVLPDEEESR